jgi:ATP-dependent Clp protease ATP-binding subunit ClpC
MSDAQQDRFKPATREVITRAKTSVAKFRHAYVTPEHILLGILDAGGEPALTALKRASATAEQIRVLVERHLRNGEFEIKAEELSFSERGKRVVETAREEATKAKAAQIGPEHLLLGLLLVRNTVAGAVLRAVDLNEESVREIVTKANA